MAVRCIAVEVSDDDFETGWGNSVSDLEASIKSALGELIGDDGGAYVPRVMLL